MSEPFRRRRPRLNWFSPLRPAQTDVAHYAMRTLPALAGHFELVVWTERRFAPSNLDAFSTVRHWENEPWTELNAADATVYHIGNNARFHGWIWDVSQRHPGIVVLHDTRLLEFFSAYFEDRHADESPYLTAIRHAHGDEVAARAAELIANGALASSIDEQLPLTDLALRRARGAVVHSGVAFQHVSARASCSVAQLDLPYNAGPDVRRRSWDGVLRLVVFGYLGANRRLDALLEAVASFPARAQLRLAILGQVDHPEALAERIQARSLDEIVRVRGFVTEAELDEELDRSHLAINLRYPTMGEASGSQLRIWSRGLASVVTRTGWYAELPEAAVLLVNPASEIADLHRHFQTAMDQPQILVQMGAAGRRRLEERHTPDVYAGELATAIRRMMETPVSVLGEGVAAVSRVLAESRISGTARAALARRAAQELRRWVSAPSGPHG